MKVSISHFPWQQNLRDIALQRDRSVKSENMLIIL